MRSNILIEETIVKFGYDPRKLRNNSEKKVVYRCPICETISDKNYRGCDKICMICSNTIKARNSIKERSLKIKKFYATYPNPRRGVPRPREVCEKMSKTRRERLASGLIKTTKGRPGLYGEKNPFFGKHHKEESKRYGEKNAMYGRSPAHAKKVWYNASDGKLYCLRSSWEHKVAVFLDKNNIKWTYEPSIIEVEYILDNKLRAGTYRPDFFLIDENKYIEVKGRWYPGYKEKFEAALLISDIPIELWTRDILKSKNIL